MPTKCDGCGEEEYAIYITSNYERLCYDCYYKDDPKRGKSFEPEDLDYRYRRI